MNRDTETDGSEDVNDFLVRIRELGNKRDKEDEERARKLEEEILQGRRERLARRAERVRSISPTKDSPSPFDASLAGNIYQSSPTSSLSVDPPLTLLPSMHIEDSKTKPAAASTIKDPDMIKTDDLAENAARSPATLRPSPRPLSWKQRPNSRDLDAGTGAFLNLQSIKSPVEVSPDVDSTPSRSHIVQSLASKDPAWFRQTTDIGIGSPAYRRAQDSSMSDVSTMSGNIRLPGLGRESIVESEKLINNDFGEHSRSLSRVSSIFGTSAAGNRFSSVSSVSTAGGLGSPVPLSTSQRLESRGSFTANHPQSTDRFEMSPAQGRFSSDRSSSPTKGLGGFVQSAMMKRSDSVSKRWSAQSSGRSNATPKPGYPAPSASLSREASDEAALKIPTSRPGSIHSEATGVRNPTKGEFEPSKSTSDVFAKSFLSSQPLSRSNSISNAGDRYSDLPSSPSKTMDLRRWSPTKATWLESALNKPDSPKSRPQTPNEPEWKRGLNNRLRQNRTSVDLGGPGSPKPPLQKENQFPPKPGSTAFMPLKEFGNSVPHNAIKSDCPKPGNAPDPGSGEQDLHIDTDVSQQQVPEKSLKTEDVKSESVSSPGERACSPAASSPVGSQKGFRSIGKASVDGISPKITPSTPPLNNDFRANLRRRELANESSTTDEPEFKHVFGKLRKTETKNYVAPDLLKHNILRGKAGLNATGGPKKGPKVDEFRESILKQKEAMKAGGGSIRMPTIESKGPSSPDNQSPEIPEAIARQRNMTRSGSIISSSSGRDVSPKLAEQPKIISPSRESKPSPFTSSDIQVPNKIYSPAAVAEIQAAIPKSSFVNGLESTKIGTAKSSRNVSSEDLADESAKKFDSPSQQSMTTKLHSDHEVSEKDANASGPTTTSAQCTSLTNTLDGQRAHSGTGKLANRLNPALAGILSRGPPSIPNTTPSPSMSWSRTEPSEQYAPAKLTHTTKSRARGPKRRLPQSAKSEPAPPSNEVSGLTKVEPSSSRPVPDAKSSNNMFKPISSPAQQDPRPLPTQLPSEKTESDAADVSSTPTSTPNDAQRSKDRPPVSSKSPDLRKFTPTSNGPTASDAGRDAVEPQLESLSSKKCVETESVALKPFARRTTFNDSFKSERKPSPPLKSSTFSSPATMPLKQKSLPLFPQEHISSPPVPPKPSSSNASNYKSPLTIAKASPFPESSEAANVFSSFFDVMPQVSDKVEVDPQSILMSQSHVYPKIKTISKQIWEITGDGKRKDLPANLGYILFEESMYVCVHVFKVANGPSNSNTTQVLLWCGDGVSEAAIEDAQLFARKVARENSCKLELVRQGKEAPSFIQALGGIIITRRGSSSRTNSSAMYMLCGRRHMGQIAFDEVDLAAKSLCSGYPYLISAKFGKLYLWQGRGSTADELGCARLIGMDLGLTGEIEEVIEGKEPPGFFETFSDPFQPTAAQTADHWKLKPTNGNYCCRLYRIDYQLGQRSGFWSRGNSSPVTRSNDIVQEIEPFCQRDLDPNHIHILDTFFEIFVIVGDRANARSAELASALIFTQEYSIMAVSLQDRPFLPRSNVVIHGMAEECKWAFRKWEDRGMLLPGKTPCVIPLSAAIEATR
ncbi:uncharacterized protein PADG_06829 [Paracoccidioides brasiliensis Pb18]|uniref:Uncharacterized protein n=1 Tax=Paracoccidioides brasiliensis (strain Pb18) TaxID=502780 RepID=C1GHU3_PARBD|nr:uncharacterized protein PADG_06829 [Paracoccidioides brasiliensis Pb18]EEH50750.1 hypothetical protein PADG_06829 [Paracoccidioides brasiliensis Pb18]